MEGDSGEILIIKGEFGGWLDVGGLKEEYGEGGMKLVWVI